MFYLSIVVVGVLSVSVVSLAIVYYSWWCAIRGKIAALALRLDGWADISRGYSTIAADVYAEAANHVRMLLTDGE